MACRRVVLASSALLIGAGVLPATAGDDWHLYQSHGRLWHATHRAIYELENRIAFLEADPESDDDYKGPVITGARAQIRGLNATLQPPRWRGAVPCCYSRKPIHLR
jgi:hypothetical protein